MEDVFANILFVLFLFGISVLAISLFFYYQLLKRRAFMDMARQLKFRYYYRSYAIPRRFAFLRQQRRGRGRHAFNILFGQYAGAESLVFDYKFNTGLGPEKKWHYCSFAVMHHGHMCPSLRIYPKSMIPALGQIVGYEEVFLDGHELSEHFVVYATDEQFARSFLVLPIVQYLQRHTELSLEVDPLWIAAGRQTHLSPEEIPYRLKQVEKLRRTLPLPNYASAVDIRSNF